MPFGKFGPGRGDARRLGDVPAGYLRWLGQQDLMHKPENHALADYIEARLFADKVESRKQKSPPVKKSRPVPPGAFKAFADSL